MNRALFGWVAVVWLAMMYGCQTDLGIDDFKYACQKETDCGEGFACQGNWCVKLDGGHDGGTADTGVHKDAGRDAGTDGGIDGGTDGGVDGGMDGGVRDGGFVLQYNSTFDSAAGVGASAGYRLKVVTGWSTGPKQGTGGYQLKIGQPFKTGEK